MVYWFLFNWSKARGSTKQWKEVGGNENTSRFDEILFSDQRTLFTISHQHRFSEVMY